MDVYSLRDIEANGGESFWQLGALNTPSAEIYLYGGELYQIFEDGKRVTHYFLLSSKYFIQCRGTSTQALRRCVVNWKRFESIEDSCYGFRLSSSSYTETFYSANPQEFTRWVDHLKSLTVLTQFEQYYALEEQIGVGAFSIVKKATNKVSQKKVAVKLVEKHSKGLLPCLKEIDIMRRMNHEAILKVLAVYDTSEHVAIVLEYAEGGSLLKFINRHIRIDEEQARDFTLKLFNGIVHIHKNSCVHRDIKLDNIVLMRPDDLTSLKIADFGLACDLETEILGKRCGSAGYIAPEIILDRSQSDKVDCFSAGVVLYILLSGTAPFRHSKEINVLKLNAECRIDLNNPYFEHISECAKNFLSKLLLKNSLERPTSREVLTLPWLTKLKQIIKISSSIEITESCITETAEVTSSTMQATLESSDFNIRRIILKGSTHSGSNSPAMAASPMERSEFVRKNKIQVQSASNSPSMAARALETKHNDFHKLPSYLRNDSELQTPQLMRRRYIGIKRVNLQKFE